MVPLVTLETMQNADGETLELVQRGETFFLRHKGDAILTSNALDADIALAELCCQPVRPARQPNILICSRGFDAFAQGVLNLLIQKRANFVIHNANPEIAAWNRDYLEHLHPDLTDDSRLVYSSTPLRELIEENTDNWHAMMVNLDILAAVSPRDLELFTTTSGLSSCAASLRMGGILGLIANQQDPKLLKTLINASFDPIAEDLPTTVKAKRSPRHEAILARKGSYKSQNSYTRRTRRK